ncbi:hypothetical protein CYMTET_30942, partial [Cymbomonas tetramitiformis]
AAAAEQRAVSAQERSGKLETEVKELEDSLVETRMSLAEAGYEKEMSAMEERNTKLALAKARQRNVALATELTRLEVLLAKDPVKGGRARALTSKT